MRSAADRFKDRRYDNITDAGVGPGSYSQSDRTLFVDAKAATARSSRIRPGFGSTTPQRPPPMYGRAVSDYTGPGCYEPLEPRLKDLKGSARIQVL